MVWRERREEETDELMETETEGQLLGFETYAWQREGTGRAGDGWEGQRGVTGEEEKMTTGWTEARDRRGRGWWRGQGVGSQGESNNGRRSIQIIYSSKSTL